MILPNQGAEDDAAYRCTAMPVYVWQLQDKLPCLISHCIIKESKAGLKKAFASYSSQIPEILCQAVDTHLRAPRAFQVQLSPSIEHRLSFWNTQLTETNLLPGYLLITRVSFKSKTCGTSLNDVSRKLQAPSLPLHSDSWQKGQLCVSSASCCS